MIKAKRFGHSRENGERDDIRRRALSPLLPKRVLVSWLRENLLDADGGQGFKLGRTVLCQEKYGAMP